MCGRYALAFVRGFSTRFEAIDKAAEKELEPRYNIAPTQEAPVIIFDSGNEVVMMRWGFIPFWAKDMKIGNRLINARAEGISKRPAFRASVKKRRCLVPASGFYEWLNTKGGKIPYFIHMRDSGLFGMAGLYDRWTSPDGGEIRSFTIVTTEPNALTKTVHNRMPVILPRDAEETWLRTEPLSEDELSGLLVPYPADQMEAFQVSKDVNNPTKDYPELILPISRSKGSR